VAEARFFVVNSERLVYVLIMEAGGDDVSRERDAGCRSPGGGTRLSAELAHSQEVDTD